MDPDLVLAALREAGVLYVVCRVKRPNLEQFARELAPLLAKRLPKPKEPDGQPVPCDRPERRADHG